MKRLRYSSASSMCGGLPCGPSAQEMETGGEELERISGHIARPSLRHSKLFLSKEERISHINVPT